MVNQYDATNINVKKLDRKAYPTYPELSDDEWLVMAGKFGKQVDSLDLDTFSALLEVRRKAISEGLQYFDVSAFVLLSDLQ
jgi:hypothetical protein